MFGDHTALEFGLSIATAMLVILLVLALWYLATVLNRRALLQGRLGALSRVISLPELEHANPAALSPIQWQEVLGHVRAYKDRETARLLTAQLLGREVRRLYELLNCSGDGFLILDKTSNVVFASKATAPFLSVAPDEAQGVPADTVLAVPSIRAAIASTPPASIELGEEEQCAGDEDTSVYFHVLGMDGGIGIIFRNNSAYNKLRGAQRDFVDSVVHEMRTPLTSIRAYVELLIDGEMDEPDAERSFYNIIYEETDRLSQLIDNLLNLSMMESDTLTLNVAPTRLKRVLDDIVEVIRPQCTQKRIELVVEFPDRLPTMDIDKQLLSVAILNIVSNAVKYTKEGGRVQFYTESLEGAFHLVVRDNGMGIAEEDQARVFEKFYRAADARGEKGSGVGLSTAREVLRLHGGDIGLKSILGKGSEFTIVLPRTLINTSIGD